MRPKNWDKFQHYKDRLPPWIKLHREILNDREFMRLPIASKAIAPLMWLLASEHEDGEFDGSVENLEFRLHISEKELKPALKALIDKGFFVDASKTLADRKQGATPETETEGETEAERETKTEKEPRTRIVIKKPDDVAQEVWAAFVAMRDKKRAPVSELVLNSIRKEASIAGISLQDALSECCVRGWQTYKASWDKNGTQKAPQESFYERELRLKREEARKWGGGDSFDDFTFDEVSNVPAIKGY